MSDKEKNPSMQELLKLIVEEVDEAREVYELAQQLSPTMPLRSFDDIERAVGDSKAVKFRGKAFGIKQFRELVPATLFPIEDHQTLVALLYQAVCIAPKHIQYDETDPRNAKRRLRRLGIMGLPTGLLGPAPGPVLYGRANLARGGNPQSHKHEKEG